MRFEHLKAEENRVQKLEYAERLLRDSLIVIGERDRIASAELVKGLREIPTSPWRTYEGAGMTEISLASMLKLFGVEPKTIRFKPKSEPNSTAKGYLRVHLAAAASATESDTDEAPGRNPVTQAHADAPRDVKAALRILPSPSPCNGCRDMHKGIAETSEANPSLSDEELAAKSGCSLVIVRQAKMRHLDWKQDGQ